MSYADVSDLLKRYDARTIGNLAGDEGVRISVDDLPTDANVLAALEDASGEIDAALLQGKRYTTDELSSLTGNSLAYLKRITCKIAFWLLWERRPWLEDDVKESAREDARKAIDRLRRGENVFDLDPQIEAGLPEQHTPTVTTIERLNLTVDAARGHFYPQRRLPGSV